MASATGASVIVPLAAAPQDLVAGGGAASAGAAPATRAPPSSASDPAAAAARLIFRFIRVPPVVLLACLYLPTWPPEASSVTT